MVYETRIQPIRTHQLTIDELLNDSFDVNNISFNNNPSNTITRKTENGTLAAQRYGADRARIIEQDLEMFLLKWGECFKPPMSSYYRVEYRDKKSAPNKDEYVINFKDSSGRRWSKKFLNYNEAMRYFAGIRNHKCVESCNFKRRLDIPNSMLQMAFTELKLLFEIKWGFLYHNSAYAYVKNRCHIDAVKKHQKNNSRWSVSIDFANFFGSITPEFTFNQLLLLHPLQNLTPHGQDLLKKVLELCFVNGGLSQGSSLSPTLTNIIMIPIDFEIEKQMRAKKMIYTRYCDDILISRYKGFNYKEVLNDVRNILESFNAPLTFNDDKTKYESRAGKNWHLGVMWNKDNNITIGSRKKKKFKAGLFQYCMSIQNEEPWSLERIQKFYGVMNYYKTVEKEMILKIVRSYGERFNIDIEKSMENEIKGRTCVDNVS